MKVYEGRRDAEGKPMVFVAERTADGRLVNQAPLQPRMDIYPHSPAGFEWGYGGSGPSQLALALCADALNNDARARRVYQNFKFQVVAKFPEAGWHLTEEQVRNAVSTLEAS